MAGALTCASASPSLPINPLQINSLVHTGAVLADIAGRNALVAPGHGVFVAPARLLARAPPDRPEAPGQPLSLFFASSLLRFVHKSLIYLTLSSIIAKLTKAKLQWCIVIGSLRFGGALAMDTLTNVSPTGSSTNERRLVSRVLHYWHDAAKGRRCPSASQIDPALVGDDWANCAVIWLDPELVRSTFILVGAHLLPPSHGAVDGEPLAACAAHSLIALL